MYVVVICTRRRNASSRMRYKNVENNSKNFLCDARSTVKQGAGCDCTRAYVTASARLIVF